jgi:hypothetical protein
MSPSPRSQDAVAGIASSMQAFYADNDLHHLERALALLPYLDEGEPGVQLMGLVVQAASTPSPKGHFDVSSIDALTMHLLSLDERKQDFRQRIATGAALGATICMRQQVGVDLLPGLKRFERSERAQVLVFACNKVANAWMSLRNDHLRDAVLMLSQEALSSTKEAPIVAQCALVAAYAHSDARQWRHASPYLKLAYQNIDPHWAGITPVLAEVGRWCHQTWDVTRDPELLDMAVRSLDQSLSVPELEPRDRLSRLVELGSACRDRYEATGDQTAARWAYRAYLAAYRIARESSELDAEQLLRRELKPLAYQLAADQAPAVDRRIELDLLQAASGSNLPESRFVRAWIDDDKAPEVRSPVSIKFQIGMEEERDLGSWPFNEPQIGDDSPIELLVMLVTDDLDAVVKPGWARLLLPVRGPTAMLTFIVIPSREGALEIRFQIRLAKEAVLLQEASVTLTVHQATLKTG